VADHDPRCRVSRGFWAATLETWWAIANAARFQTCTSTLSETDLAQRLNEELVLRFFALKNAQEMFHGSIRDWLDDYMEAVVFGTQTFEYDSERRAFDRLFDFLNDGIGEGAFVKYRDDKPIGGLAPAYFEAVSIGTWRAMQGGKSFAAAAARAKIIAAVQTNEFRSQVGPAANSRPKLRRRVEIIEEALTGLAK
jgi:hypothetical protein